MVGIVAFKMELSGALERHSQKYVVLDRGIVQVNLEGLGCLVAQPVVHDIVLIWPVSDAQAFHNEDHNYEGYFRQDNEYFYFYEARIPFHHEHVLVSADQVVYVHRERLLEREVHFLHYLESVVNFVWWGEDLFDYFANHIDLVYSK